MSNQPAYYSVYRIRFEFRKSQGKDVQKGVIYSVIYVEGQAPSLQTTGIRCTRSDWETRTAPRNTLSAKNLNEKLILWENAIRSAARTLTERGEPITVNDLLAEKNYLKNPLLSLESVVDQYLTYKRTKIGHKNAGKRKPGQISPDTFRTYGVRHNWLKKFLKVTRSEKIKIVKVDTLFVNEYHTWLSDQPIGASFATKCVKLLTEIHQWARARGLVKSHNELSFRGSGAPLTTPYNVTQEEIERIGALDLPPMQAKIRDGWLLARELCLHFSDFISLKPEHFSVGDKGRIIFEKARTKQESGRDIHQISIVSGRAFSIWNQYGQKIPILRSSVQYGRIIAEIGMAAGLERRLTFSHARDSGIFHLVINNCSDHQIKLAAGWTTTKQLTRYVNFDRRLLESLATPTEPQTVPKPTQPFFHIYKAS